MIPEESAPRTKYFSPASEALASSRRKAARTYSASDCSSTPI
jgi:hypothetical protein